MPAPDNLLILALREPTSVLGLSSQEWIELERQARRTRLLARLAVRFREAQVWQELPRKVQEHLESALAVAEQHQRGIRWEVNRIVHALRDVDCPIVLLKGAAYVIADLPVARGRVVSDVDILVPRESLAIVERSLMSHGWTPLKANEYDDHYYRKWMHELPPLKHSARHTVIDVHHTILPLTGRLHPDPALLLEDAQPLASSRARTLSPVDMVIHAAAHLFQDGEIAGGLRDLSDLDLLMRHFGENVAGFWSRLAPRAEQLNLTRPLYYALRVARGMIETPVPDEAFDASARGGPTHMTGRFVESLCQRALLPGGQEARWASATATSLLYLRAHWLRMPPWLLVPHLAHKSLRRLFPAS